MAKFSKEVLLVARKRAFWDLDFCKNLFASRYILPVRMNPFLYIIFFPLLVFKLLRGVRVVVVGTSMPYVKFLAFFKRRGIFKKLKIVTDHQFLSDEVLEQVNTLIAYSAEQENLYREDLRGRVEFIHFPAKTGLLETTPNIERGDYIFAGGNHKRDFRSIIEAVTDMPVKLKIFTGQKVEHKLPSNVFLSGQVALPEYIEAMARSRFVVIPLMPGPTPHGHCDISNAMTLGKPVITTKGASADAYIEEGKTGFLVEGMQPQRYREAINKFKDDVLLQEMEKNALEAGKKMNYEHFASRLENIISRHL